MVSVSFVPDRGDIVFIDCDPQRGREQTKRRPALVLTDRVYNDSARLCVVCPITSVVKGYPFEVPIPPGGKVGGVVLADQLRSFDWKARRAKWEERAPAGLVDEVLDRIADLLEM